MYRIRITINGDTSAECPAGTVVGSIAPPETNDHGLPYIAALINNDVASLSYPIPFNAHVRLVTRSDPHGWRVYRRSLCFLLSKAVRELYPDATFSLEHSFGPGLYCSFRTPQSPEATPGQVAAIEERMHDLVRRNLPVTRRKVAYCEALAHFEQTGQTHKLNLLKFRNPPHVVVHECEGFSDLSHGPLASRTGVLDLFQLIPYRPGFVISLPEREAPLVLPPFEDQPQLFQIFKEHKDWGRILGVNTVGRLNEIIDGGEIDQFMNTAEALHEKKLARIADAVCGQGNRIRLILIAGPSSAGKTTFAKRLEVHLRANGVRPVTLGTDDYFVGLDRNPRDEQGNPDFEHIEAVDLELFNAQLVDLINGREITPPRFDFATKSRQSQNRAMRLAPDQILIVEGIHGLNPRLTEMVPADRKFKIYVSALTQLSIDADNRVSTTDNRLMRRMVRDHRYRGHSALDTLKLWQSVRRGEKRWIFPFQREANATFNSALDYELAVLKPMVEPLLMQIKPSHPEYAEARRLSEFLLNFLPVDSRAVPRTSILREYIGGSVFRY